MKTYDCNACQEAYVIVSYLLETGEIVLPERILEILEKNRNVKYSFDINDIQNRTLLPETEKIITYIYMNFIATSSEKSKINKAVKSLKKVITGDTLNEECTDIVKITLKDKIRQALFKPIKI